MDRVLLRLSDKERETLQLLHAALRVSEYTDDVDDFRRYRREDKMMPCLTEFFSTVVGLTVAASELPAAVRQELEEGDRVTYRAIQPILSSAFEVARRHKRLNPHHYRSEYGKLVMILQDANAPSRLQTMKIKALMLPVATVGSTLERIGAADLLNEECLNVATEPLTARGGAEEAAAKKDAMAHLLQKYGGGGGATSTSGGGAGDVENEEGSKKNTTSSSNEDRRELIERCLLSIADVKSFIQSCVSPLTTLLEWLDKYFVKETKSGYRLDIRSGLNGSCLSHDHETQVAYVKESLTLWSVIQRDILDFWEVVEDDMIIACEGRYQFCDTGQGYHRMLSAPKTYSRMQAAISEVHRKLGRWVGIKVVHLGDRDVPNALVFIDKYTAIPKIVAPVVHTIERIDAIFDESQPEAYPGIRNLLRSKYESGDSLKRKILCDFFKHAFDGSGDDGGNCIDGRLTSAWNWCQLLHKKDYYDAFVLTGFTGFD